MVVDDSKKTRRRIIAFIVSRGGSVSSGQNDSFLRWMLELLRTGAYAHERVDDLRATLEAMEEDGEIVLGYAEGKSRKIIGVQLPDDTDINTVEVNQDDLDLFDRDALWRLVNSLRYQRDQALRRAIEVEEAFGQLALEDGKEQLTLQVSDLEATVRELSDQTVFREQEIARVRAEMSSRLAHKDSERQQLLANQERVYEKKLRDLRARIERKSSELEATKRELRIVKDLSHCPPALLAVLDQATGDLAERLRQPSAV